MIISDLLVENFRKYQYLYLQDLPENGLVVVAGGNESGKSSIGEAISFALFGRTEALAEARTGKLVFWGAEQATVSLSFQHQGRPFRITRKVDKAGNQIASLSNPDTNVTLASTPADVDQQLKALLGYGYPAFVRTFYWSQLTQGDSQADADSLQAMTGVKAYAKLDEQLQQEQQETHALVAQLEADHHATLAARDAIGLDEGRLPSLLEIRETLEDRQQGSLRLMKDMGAASQNYPENYSAYQHFRWKSRHYGWLGVLGIVVLLLVLAAWGVLTFLPHLLAGLSLPVFVAQPDFPRGLLWAGVVIAILTSILLLFGWHVERNRLQPLRGQSRALGKALSDSLKQLRDSLPSQLGEKASAYLQQRNLLNAAEDVPAAAVPDSLPQQVHLYMAAPDQVTHTAAAVAEDLVRHSSKLGDFAAVVGDEAAQERTLVDQYMALNKEATEQGAIIDGHKHQVQVKGKATELLRQASSYSIERFNQIVHNRCQGLLSEFTQSHYKDLAINTDFALRVLSEEKGDYLDFDEISAGTQRQIALAMRIALANSLADSNDTAQQFMFLDEPFAFFDQNRTAAALSSLREASKGSLQQIWVTAQAVPEGVGDARIIECKQGETSLNA